MLLGEQALLTAAGGAPRLRDRLSDVHGPGPPVPVGAVPHADGGRFETYAFALLVLLGAALGSAWLVRRRLDRIDLVEVLKTRE